MEAVLAVDYACVTRLHAMNWNLCYDFEVELQWHKTYAVSFDINIASRWGDRSLLQYRRVMMNYPGTITLGEFLRVHTFMSKGSVFLPVSISSE